MRRGLVVLASAALTGAAVAVPITSADAATSTHDAAASWVNGTLRVTYSFVKPTTYVSDSEMVVEVDGKYVDATSDAGFQNRVFAMRRAASEGPAKVAVLSMGCVDGSNGEQCTPTTVYSNTVLQHVVKAKKGQVSAYALLNTLTIVKEARAASFAAAKFGPWTDIDGDGLNTRAEVLKAESTEPVTLSGRHVVTSGRWVSSYDGTVHTKAGDMVVDHLVPLDEAWVSGASTWSASRRAAFANDLGYGRTLVAVSKAAAREKAAQGTGDYRPSKASSVCAYVRDSIAIKSRWGLSVDPAEKAALQHDLVATCQNLFVTKPSKR